MNISRRLSILTLFLAATAAVSPYLLVRFLNRDQSEAAQTPSPRYIFIFLADGAGLTHLEIARQYSQYIHKEGLTITDKITKEGYLGLLTTHPADSLSTDSAAAATSMASGCKAKIGAIGNCEDGTIPKTVLEVAKEKGMRIGLVTNSTIYDASPAAFAGHVPSRKLFSQIIDQYLNLEPDLLMGGGRNMFLPRSQQGSRRQDENDMIASFQKKGYVYASNKEELSRAKGSKLLGLFSLNEMSFELDRDTSREPSIYDMTKEAIRLLQEGNRRGFAVFIETENVDSASHLTDVASVIHALREFDRALGLAHEFYQRHPRETLILATSDHETGGIGFTLALKDMSSTKGSNMIDGKRDDLKKIQSVSISLKKAAEILGPNPTAETVDRLMQDYFKGFVLAPEFKDAILKSQPLSRAVFAYPTANALGMMIANNTQAYWMTTAHTNQPVFVAALGVGAEKFRGYQDNTDFANHLFALLDAKDGPKTTNAR